MKVAQPSKHMIFTGPPGELLLYVFGRRAVARVEVSGPLEAIAAVHRTHFGM
ncbi:TIGR03085 family protein [Mycobacterium tuberculosis]|nr:TIGR03085 family protein [Mycobacterium tuberculosis]